MAITHAQLSQKSHGRGLPLSNIAEFIDEHGALGGKVLEHYGDLEEAKKALEEHYAGE